MNDKDVKAILWLLEEIEKDKIIRSYFQHNLNLQNTDLARLIKIFKDLVEMCSHPMYYADNKILIPITQNLEIIK